MSQITVAVNGALGRMGQQVMSAVIADPSFSLTCASDIKADKEYVVLPGHDPKNTPAFQPDCSNRDVSSRRGG